MGVLYPYFFIVMTEKITNEFIKYKKVIFSLLRKFRPAASTQDIEDILQDTFINTYQSSLKQPIQFPKAFMVKTAFRLANRMVTTTKNVSIEDFSTELLFNYDEVGFLNQTEQECLLREDFQFLCEAINQLPEQCRKVFILKKVYGLSQREVAQKLGISESTVEKHVAKGLLKTCDYYEQAKSFVKTNDSNDGNEVVNFDQKRKQ